jgi:hypothetical protein
MPAFFPDGWNTIIGILVAATPIVASFFGYHTSPNFQGDAVEIGSAVVSVIGSVYALYGRVRAAVPGWFAR